MNPRGAAWREERERREKELASDTLIAWQTLCSQAGSNADIDKLIELASTCGETPGTAEVGKLRRLGDAQLVHAALQLAKARRKAKGKLQESTLVLADPEGIEMSSSTLVAHYKARRLATVLGRDSASNNSPQDHPTVLDVCCGVGGDAVELARLGLRVVAVDSDPMRVAMCEANVRRAEAGQRTDSQAHCMSAEDLLTQNLPARALHIDPSRRSAASRLQPSVRTNFRGTAWDELLPPHEVVGSLVERYQHLGIKQRAGMDLHTMPAWMPACETEIISEDGKLTQCMVWTGDLRSDEARAASDVAVFRRATLLVPSQHDDRTQMVLTLWQQRAPSPLPFSQVSTFLYEPDDSIERAELLAELCDLLRAADSTIGMPHPRAGLLTSNHRIESGWVRAFEVLAHEPYRAKTLAKTVASFNPGHVEVKTRGKLVNPDELQPKLSAKGGGQPLTIFVVRFGEEPHLIVTKRL